MLPYSQKVDGIPQILMLEGCLQVRSQLITKEGGPVFQVVRNVGISDAGGGKENSGC